MLPNVQLMQPASLTQIYPYSWAVSMSTCQGNPADSGRCGGSCWPCHIDPATLYVKSPQGVGHICIWVSGLQNRHIQTCRGETLFISMPPPPTPTTRHFTQSEEPIRVSSSLLGRRWWRVSSTTRHGLGLLEPPPWHSSGRSSWFVPPLSSTDPSLVAKGGTSHQLGGGQNLTHSMHEQE